MIIYDLHSHSIASDGTLTPEELVCQAASANVHCLALTDHDTMAGVERAAVMAQQAGLKLVPGTELSATWGGRTLHIVGLHVRADNPVLKAGIKRHLDYRHWRGKEIARRLEKRGGVVNAYQGALEFVHGSLVSRSHFARYLVKAGYAKNFPVAIRKYLLNGKPGYVKGEWASLHEVVSWIRQSGGIAVLAHPARYKLSATKMRQLLDDFVQSGGEALEVVSGSHTVRDVRNMTGYALKYDLLASAGSDFHGPENVSIKLGQLMEIPDSCTPIWQSTQWQERH